MTTQDKPFRRAKVHPKYLHSNSTSHVWIFGAIAELIDNARDSRPTKSSNPLKLHIDVSTINKNQCLIFTDNGRGMSTDDLYNMLSFGFSEDDTTADKSRIGRYGNGFKSGSMRLGKDVLVLTISEKTCSVGLLSRTYLASIAAEEILVPLATLDRHTKQHATPADYHELNIITKITIFSREEIINQLNTLDHYIQ